MPMLFAISKIKENTKTQGKQELFFFSYQCNVINIKKLKFTYRLENLNVPWNKYTLPLSVHK